MAKHQTTDHDHGPTRRLARRWMPSRDYQKPWVVSTTDHPRKLIYLPVMPLPRRPR